MMVQGSVGVDIGGTKVAVGFVDELGKIISRRQFSTEVAKGPEAITAQIADEVKGLIKQGGYQIKGVGVGMAGQIDSASGVVHFAPNLQWREFPFAQRLGEQIGVPVAVTNDVKAATWGEWMFGAGKGQKDLVCLFVGTGIGGGIVSGGKMLQGATNCAGELGHMIIELNGPKCHCGSYGCFEALAGGWAIGHIAQELASHNPQQAKLLLELSGGDLGKINAKLVSQAAQQGDPLATKIFDDVVQALVAGVVSVVNGLNPATVILGGGVIEGNRALIPKVEAGVRQRALQAATKNLKIEGAALKNDAGMIGAASYVLNRG